MSTLSGLPAHILLVHAIVVLVPLTAVLLIACAVWPLARRRWVWPAVGLTVLVVALTPLTVNAGEWLQHRLGSSPAIDHHADLGEQMLYFVAPLLVPAVLLAVAQVRETRGTPFGRAVVVLIAVIALAAGAAAVFQTYRVGDAGAHAVWDGTTA
ncbi:DUF2231 domain-containing protein [Nocardia jejuensis]|uniref:DUF2231 domain-containing protein n=1 Tax=Nocardia jejuensis TaxID=328049 RepID=UPI00082C4407|nr:DUF2231 domain-containing protein [Nocardia jejuensis]